MPSRPCAEAGCPRLATYRGRCQVHQPSRQRAGRKVYDSKRWRITRRHMLRLKPLCECGSLATEVHHRLAIEDGGDPWGLDNLVTMCKPCHSRTTRREQLRLV